MHTFRPYESLVRLLSNILDAYTTAFFLYHPKNRELRLVAAQTLSKHLNDRACLPLEQSGLLGQVHKVGQNIQMDKVPTNTVSATLPFYRDGESHIKGLFAVPVGDEAGVLYADTKYSWGFNDKQIKWIREIGVVLNELLERQHFVHQHGDYARILDLWQDLDEAAWTKPDPASYARSVVTHCTRFLGADYGFLAVQRPDEPKYGLLAATPNVAASFIERRFSRERGLVGWVLNHQKALLIPRLNPQTSDHFLFMPKENLPHYGTFWGLPVGASHEITPALAFLSEGPVEWSGEDQQVIIRMTRFVNLVLDRYHLRDECSVLLTRDRTSGLCNGPTFETILAQTHATAMQDSTEFTLALVQFEPWFELLQQGAPSKVRQWHKHLVKDLCKKLPLKVVVGHLAENRFGLIFPQVATSVVEYCLLVLEDLGKDGPFARSKGVQVRPYSGWVSFPQDGARVDDLWVLAYRRLFSSFGLGRR